MWIAKYQDLIIDVKSTREELLRHLDMVIYDSIEETDINYQLYNGQYLTPEQIIEKEKERIGNLQVTKRVFALALQQLGITYTQLKELIAMNEQAQLEWDLCIELQRKNPLLDIMGSQLGITPEQIDYIFRTANGEEIEPVTVIEESTENNEESTENNSEEEN